MSDSEHSVCTTCHGAGRADVPVCPDCGYRAPRPASSLSRDELGRIVREAWVRWAGQQPEPRPGWLIQWPDLNEADREVDRLIGEAVAAAIEPPRPEAIVYASEGVLHAFEDCDEAITFSDANALDIGGIHQWIWHPKSP